MTGGVKSVVANLDEARRQDVLHEAREQLVSRHGDRPPVLGAEGDAAFVHRDEALVGDADAVGVAAEVANDLLGSTEGTLGVDDPGLAVERAQVDAADVEAPGHVRMLDRREHLAAEQIAHDAHREEEVAARTHPARVIVREPAAGDDGVHVRMEAELARPRVEHHRDAELAAETFRVAGEREEGLRRACQEHHVED